MKAGQHTSFTKADVLNIRRLGREGYVARQVADLYKVAPETIRKIWRGETFRNLTEGEPLHLRASRPVCESPTEERLADSPLYEEPSEAEIAASLARLQAAPSSRPADDLLAELEQKGGKS